MEWMALALATTVAVGLTQNRTKDFLPDEIYAMNRKEELTKQNKEIGMNWTIQQVRDLHLTNLNHAHVPYSAPSQEPTYNYVEIAESDADRSTFLNLYGPRFFFRDNTEIPLSTAAAHTTNVEIPSSRSIKGDTNASLGSLPRVYIDKPSHTRNDLFAGEYGSTGAMGAGESEVWNELHVPETGQLNYSFYPYGPGGAVQRLQNNINERITKLRGTNRATMIGPPIFTGVLDHIR